MAEHVWIHQTQLMWHLMPMDTSASVLRVLEGLIVKVGHLKNNLVKHPERTITNLNFVCKCSEACFLFFDKRIKI